MSVRSLLAPTAAILVHSIAVAAPGAVVEEIVKRSSADRAGLLVGDVITAWSAGGANGGGPAGADVASPVDAYLMGVEIAPRGPVVLTVRRGAEEHRLELPPGSFGLTLGPALEKSDAGYYALARDDEQDADRAVQAWVGLAAAARAAGHCDTEAWLLSQAASRLRTERRLDEAVTYREMAAAALCPERRDAKHAWLLNAAGVDLWRLSEYDEATIRLEAALALRRALAPRSLAVADSLKRLAMVANNQGRFEESGAFGEEALGIFEALAPGSMAHAELLHQLGNRAFWSDHLDDAYRLYGEAAELRRVLEPDGLQYARGIATIGNVAWRQDELEYARSLFEEARDITGELMPGSNLYAGMHAMLGHVASDRRDFLTAEEHYMIALDIRETADPYAIGTANVVMGLGNLERRRRNPDGARTYLERARDIYERLKSRHRIAMVNNNLANLAADQGRYDDAQALYLQALEFRRENSPRGWLIATTLFNLARLERDRGDVESAEGYFLEAADIFEETAPDGLRLSETMTALGELLLPDDDGRAEQYLERGLALGERLAPGTFFEAQPLYALGRLAERRGDDELALDLYSKALDAFESQRRIVGGSTLSRANFADHYAYFYKDYIELLIRRARIEDAFHVQERYRARVMLGMWAERMPSAVDLPDSLEEERLRLYRAYDRALDDLLDVDDADAATSTERGATLAAIREQRKQLATRIRAASPRLAAIEYPEPVTSARAIAALSDDTVVLSYSVTPATTYLFVLDAASGLDVFDLGMQESALREQVEAYRVLVRAPPDNVAFSESLAERGHWLFTRLVEPAAARLEGKHRVLVIPDGPLHYLPFAALATSAPRGGQAPGYLVKRHAVRQSLSMTTFLGVGVPPASKGEGEVVVFAEPAHGPRTSALAPLAGAREEAETIGRLYAQRAEVFLAEQATERRAKALGHGVGVLHFATHAVLDTRQPLDSYLALAPDINREDNGLLQAWEVMEQMRIDGALVTLSGCETHLGPATAGEGLIGLTRAFQYAGARSVLATLWAVSDRATAELMRNYYDALEDGADADLALRRAQLAMLEAEPSLWTGFLRNVGVRTAPPADWSHPYYWAGFRLTGVSGLDATSLASSGAP